VIGTPRSARAADFERLSSVTWDVLVIGGGIVGVGAALDAALRGARVALVERDDIASGTSSRSSKLIHGGLRYLEQFQFRLVGEALGERRRLLRLAPHLVRLEPFLVPVYGSPILVPYLGAGLTLYGVLGAARDGGWPRFVTRRRALALSPALRRDRLRGAYVYWDGVEDDARLALATARTARRAGALILTRAEAGPLTEGAPAVIDVRDRLGVATASVSARVVIDATGASDPDAGTLPSRGSHIVVARDRIPTGLGMTIRVPGRVIFVIPWHRHWLIGTTDVVHHGSTHRPTATREEVDYLLRYTNEALDVDLTTADVVATYAGIRPLAVRDRRGVIDSVQASREHRVRRHGSLVTVRGGKFTTYGVIARDVVDAALGKVRPHSPSATDQPLIGAGSPAELAMVRSTLEARYRLSARLAERLVGRHGTQALDVARQSVRAGLLRPLGSDGDYLEGEVLWAVRHEWALSLDDVLARRTRLAIEARDHGQSVAERVADILGEAIGWTAAQRQVAVAEYRCESDREYGVPAASATDEILQAVAG
jgi:glycerol-3-phosphate dehydrogenase